MCVFLNMCVYFGERVEKKEDLTKPPRLQILLPFSQTFTDNLLKYLFFKSNSKFIMAVTITGNWYAVRAG